MIYIGKQCDLILECKDISKVHPGQSSIISLKQATISIERGKFYAIMGASGSGKTTLLQLLGLLDTPSSGELKVNNKFIQDLNELEKAKLRMQTVGFIFQSFHLLSHLKAWENVCFSMLINSSISPGTRKSKAYELLDIVGVLNVRDSFPKQMSGGEQQRVAIARALANDPICLLADEPTGNLDSESERNILRILRYLCDRNHSVVVVTHNKIVAKEADEVFYMEKGILRNGVKV